MRDPAGLRLDVVATTTQAGFFAKFTLSVVEGLRMTTQIIVMKFLLVITVAAALAVVLFFFFGGFGEKFFLPQEIQKQPAPSAVPPAATTSTSPSTSSGDIKQPPLASPSEPPQGEKPSVPSAEFPKCEHRGFTIRILGVDRADPTNLTIHVGDTLTFINESSDLRWPGADPHPTHSSLPLFDALGGISQGQSYSHTFKQEGRYGWHDHIPDNPPTVGFITVLPCE